jgi:DNA-binding NarL/FixJ family response regulator
LLSEQDEVEIVGSASGYDELVSCAHRLRPDVVVTDVRMPPTFTDEGVRAAVELRHQYPSLGVVVLTQFIDPGYLSALISDGSNGRGYLLKERVATPGELTAAVRTIAAGGSVIDPLVVDALVSAGMRSRRSPMQRLILQS